jgi:hypothetical protein
LDGPNSRATDCFGLGKEIALEQVESDGFTQFEFGLSFHFFGEIDLATPFGTWHFASKQSGIHSHDIDFD